MSEGGGGVRGGRDRRAFLRAATGMALGIPLAATGCVPDDPADRVADGGEVSGGGSTEAITRPVLRPWGADVVHLVAPPAELPVAYVSMALRQVFVDHAFRDRASWLLDAHISVSTWHWRIPLPGDPEGQPVVPGDARREFEELPMRAWDPSMPPSMDDIRIVRGRPVLRTVDVRCVPLAGGDGGREAWISAGPFELPVAGAPHVDGPDAGRARRSPGGASTVREDFRVVGSGWRHDGRECREEGEAIRLVSWARRA